MFPFSVKHEVHTATTLTARNTDLFVCVWQQEPRRDTVILTHNSAPASLSLCKSKNLDRSCKLELKQAVRVAESHSQTDNC